MNERRKFQVYGYNSLYDIWIQFCVKYKKIGFVQRKIVSYFQMIFLILFSYLIVVVIDNQRNLEKEYLRVKIDLNLFKIYLIKVSKIV